MDATPPRVIDALQRLRGIFLEVPGTKLSMADATRLSGLERRCAESCWRRSRSRTSWSAVTTASSRGTVRTPWTGDESPQPPDAVAAETAEPVHRGVDTPERFDVVAVTPRASNLDRRLGVGEHFCLQQQLRCPPEIRRNQTKNRRFSTAVRGCRYGGRDCLRIQKPSSFWPFHGWHALAAGSH